MANARTSGVAAILALLNIVSGTDVLFKHATVLPTLLNDTAAARNYKRIVDYTKIRSHDHLRIS
jgi:hypothetical protein